MSDISDVLNNNTGLIGLGNMQNISALRNEVGNLGRIIQEAQLKADAEKLTLELKKEFIFKFSTNLNYVIKLANPILQYLWLEKLIKRFNEVSIKSEAFPDFKDKEFLDNVSTNLLSSTENCYNSLSEDELKSLELFQYYRHFNDYLARFVSNEKQRRDLFSEILKISTTKNNISYLMSTERMPLIIFIGVIAFMILAWVKYSFDDSDGVVLIVGAVIYFPLILSGSAEFQRLKSNNKELLRLNKELINKHYECDRLLIDALREENVIDISTLEYLESDYITFNDKVGLVKKYSEYHEALALELGLTLEDYIELKEL